MSMHPEFPVSPYDPLLPAHRWFPANEALRESSYKFLYPRVRDFTRFHLLSTKGANHNSPGQRPGFADSMDLSAESAPHPGVNLDDPVIVGEVRGGGLELAFARFLEDAADVRAFAKNYLAVGFTDYK